MKKLIVNYRLGNPVGNADTKVVSFVEQLKVIKINEIYRRLASVSRTWMKYDDFITDTAIKATIRINRNTNSIKYLY